MGCSFANTEWHSRCICIYINIDIFIHKHIYMSYNRTHIWNANIYIYINTELLDGNQGHQEETHRFLRLFLDLLSMGWRGCASAMGAIKLPPSCSSPKIMCQSIHMIIKIGYRKRAQDKDEYLRHLVASVSFCFCLIWWRIFQWISSRVFPNDPMGM